MNRSIVFQRKLVSILFLLFFHPICSQVHDSTVIKTAVSDTLFSDIPKHSIKKAAIFSAMIPGTGQVYNHLAMPKGQKKAHWKLPLIYAGLGLTSYLAINKHKQQNALKQEYTNRTQYNTIGVQYANYDNTALIMLYNQALNQRDLLFIAVGLVYTVQIVDAAVEAHFINFEVSQDLSLTIGPCWLSSETTLAKHAFPIGLSFQLNFK